jgi:hypothetical protein
MKEQMTIFHSEELHKITKTLKNPPKTLLNRMKDEARKIISHYCTTLNNSPPWTIFQPSKDIRKNELQSFQGFASSILHFNYVMNNNSPPPSDYIMIYAEYYFQYDT